MNYPPIKSSDLDDNLEKIAIPWAPLAVIEQLFNQPELEQKYAKPHDKILDKKILQMAIKNIMASNSLRTFLTN